MLGSLRPCSGAGLSCGKRPPPLTTSRLLAASSVSSSWPPVLRTFGRLWGHRSSTVLGAAAIERSSGQKTNLRPPACHLRPETANSDRPESLSPPRAGPFDHRPAPLHGAAAFVESEVEPRLRKVLIQLQRLHVTVLQGARAAGVVNDLAPLLTAGLQKPATCESRQPPVYEGLRPERQNGSVAEVHTQVGSGEADVPQPFRPKLCKFLLFPAFSSSKGRIGVELYRTLRTI